MSLSGAKTPSEKPVVLVKLLGEARLERWQRALRRRVARLPIVGELVERIVLWDATEEPRAVAGEIIWRSRQGPRRHALKLADPNKDVSEAWSTRASGQRTRWVVVGASSFLNYLQGDSEVRTLSVEEARRAVGQGTVDAIAVDLSELATPSIEVLFEEARSVSVACFVWRDAGGSPDPSLMGRLPGGATIFEGAHALGAGEGKGEGRSCLLGPALAPRLPPPCDFEVSDGEGSARLPLEIRSKLELRRRTWTLPGVRRPELLFVSAESERHRIFELLHKGALLCATDGCDPGPLLEGAPCIKRPSVALVSLWLDEQHDLDLAKLAHQTARFGRRTLSYEAARRRLYFHAGLPAEPVRPPSVGVICVSRRVNLLAEVLRTFRAFDYPNKKLICVLNQDQVPARDFEGLIAEAPDVLFLRTTSSASLGESLNRARSVLDTELWTKMDDDDHYGPNYLRDAVEALMLSGADVVGKGTYFVHLPSSRALFLRAESPALAPSDRFIHGGTILARTESTRDIKFQPVVRGTDSLFLQECKLNGLGIFSSDPFNFAYIRYEDPRHHTFDVSTESFVARATLVARDASASDADC